MLKTADASTQCKRCSYRPAVWSEWPVASIGSEIEARHLGNSANFGTRRNDFALVAPRQAAAPKGRDEEGGEANTVIRRAIVTN